MSNEQQPQVTREEMNRFRELCREFQQLSTDMYNNLQELYNISQGELHTAQHERDACKAELSKYKGSGDGTGGTTGTGKDGGGRRRGGLGWGKKKIISKCDTKANCLEAINKLKLVGGDGNADRKVMNEWYGPGKYPLMNDAAENDVEYKELLTALAKKIAGVDNGALYFNNLFSDIRKKSNFWAIDLKAAYKKTGLMDNKAEMEDSYLPYD